MEYFAIISVLTVFSLNLYYMNKINRNKGGYFFNKYKSSIVRTIISVLFSISLFIGFVYLASLLAVFLGHIRSAGLSEPNEGFIIFFATYPVVILALGPFAILQYNYLKEISCSKDIK